LALTSSTSARARKSSAGARRSEAKVPARESAAKDAAVEARERAIKEAALRCIRRHGVRKVAVEDIAIAAGVSRRTFYRFYTGRRALMEAIVLDRLRVLAEGVKAVIRECDDFESRVVRGSVETMRLARADKIYHDIVGEDNTLMFDENPGSPDGPREVLSTSIWADVFERAREEGVLRPTITNHEAQEWLIDAHRLLVMREDLSEDEQADRLRRFVLPAFMTTPPA
jgi:AcrR family transcriptional regulator